MKLEALRQHMTDPTMEYRAVARDEHKALAAGWIATPHKIGSITLYERPKPTPPAVEEAPKKRFFLR